MNLTLLSSCSLTTQMLTAKFGLLVSIHFQQFLEYIGTGEQECSPASVMSSISGIKAYFFSIHQLLIRIVCLAPRQYPHLSWRENDKVCRPFFYCSAEWSLSIPEEKYLQLLGSCAKKTYLWGLPKLARGKNKSMTIKNYNELLTANFGPVQSYRVLGTQFGVHVLTFHWMTAHPLLLLLLFETQTAFHCLLPMHHALALRCFAASIGIHTNVNISELKPNRVWMDRHSLA